MGRIVVPDATGADCEQMMYGKSPFIGTQETNRQAAYQLHAAYELPKQNTTGLIGTEHLLILKVTGAWLRVSPKMSLQWSTRLNPDAPESAIYFLKLDDNLLHVLSPEKRLMVGNGGWSYTLNRTDKGDEPQPVSSPLEPQPSLNEVSTSGVFEGRTPCADLVVEFTKFRLLPLASR